MSRSESGAVREVQGLVDLGWIGGLADGELLDRFVDRREEAVFAVLVGRHGPMVWGVCRRILRDHHAAEDAFQAVFLVLARRAAAVSPRDRVGPWLHGVAVRTAMKARGVEARRRSRESLVADPPDVAAPMGRGDPSDDLLPRLDREVSRLPAKYRAPVVLCELEGKTYREAADQLGWPIGTVSGRLTRARAILARRLRCPELASPTGSLGFLIVARTAGATVPSRLVDLASKLAALVASGDLAGAEALSAGSVTLMRGVLKTMLLSQIKIIAFGLTLGVTLAAGGTGFALHAWAGDVPGPAVPVAAEVREPGPSPPTEVASPPVEPPRSLDLAEPLADKAATQEAAVDPMKLYSFELDTANIREFNELTINFAAVQLKTGPVAVIPLTTERGITGAMLLGTGTYRYTAEKDKPIEGQFRSAMLRFNPGEQAAMLPLDRGKKISDRGATELCQLMLSVVVRHCYQGGSRTSTGQRRQDLMIPPKGAFAAVLYSKEHGDLLLSITEKTGLAYSFSDGKTLYEKK